MRYEPDKGINIYQAAEKAVQIAQATRDEVKLVFNDIMVYVSPSSNTEDIVTIYALKCEIRRLTKEKNS